MYVPMRTSKLLRSAQPAQPTSYTPSLQPAQQKGSNATRSSASLSPSPLDLEPLDSLPEPSSAPHVKLAEPAAGACAVVVNSVDVAGDNGAPGVDVAIEDEGEAPAPPDEFERACGAPADDFDDVCVALPDEFENGRASAAPLMDRLNAGCVTRRVASAP